MTRYENIEEFQKCKINSLTWYEIIEKIQKSKINSLTWYDFIEFDFFRVQLCIQISMFSEFWEFSIFCQITIRRPDCIDADGLLLQ